MANYLVKIMMGQIFLATIFFIFIVFSQEATFLNKWLALCLTFFVMSNLYWLLKRISSFPIKE